MWLGPRASKSIVIPYTEQSMYYTSNPPEVKPEIEGTGRKLKANSTKRKSRDNLFSRKLRILCIEWKIARR
ncbi:Hypothetical predicted protein [Olea europaea subsp. europaea]|uniref:Uncharacterized protein n=1 Tax=Olea europaea subsp. europaea TaxID=158383 RepID=A0A8S0P970_OLEEU|nr:Hypothetical predicted protein [Olea europaea subsp. europaea]